MFSAGGSWKTNGGIGGGIMPGGGIGTTPRPVSGGGIGRPKRLSLFARASQEAARRRQGGSMEMPMSNLQPSLSPMGGGGGGDMMNKFWNIQRPQSGYIL